MLQDFDKLVEANDSTSLLTTRAKLGEKKTRAMALWCESRGFRTSIVERRFADDFRVAGDEPRVALCGVDNAPRPSRPRRCWIRPRYRSGTRCRHPGIPCISDSHFPGAAVCKESMGDAGTPA